MDSKIALMLLAFAPFGIGVLLASLTTNGWEKYRKFLRFGVVLFAVTGSLKAAFFFANGYSSQEARSDFAGVPPFVFHVPPGSIRMPRPEVATDAEVAAIAAAKPKIDLDSDADAYRRQALEAAQKDWDAERIRANDEAYGADAEAKRIKFLEAALREAGEKQSSKDESKDTDKKRPAWANGDVAENQTVITSGPFTTAESCREDTQTQLLFWVGTFFFGSFDSSPNPDFVLSPLMNSLSEQKIDNKQFIKAQHEETRETSVGEVHLLYTLAEMTPELQAKIEKAMNDARVEKTQTDRIGAVTVLGAGVVSLVALAHVVLRAGGRQAGSNAP